MKASTLFERQLVDFQTQFLQEGDKQVITCSKGYVL
jgi:hypothetical protein